MSGAAPVVLVVEDDKGVRDLLDTILGAAGFDVHTAGDGMEGLRKLRTLGPAVLILDVMMPEVGGLKVLDELATDHADIPVIVVTGATQAADAARLRLGRGNVFTKPFDIDVLIDRIWALVDAEEGAG